MIRAIAHLGATPRPARRIAVIDLARQCARLGAIQAAAADRSIGPTVYQPSIAPVRTMYPGTPETWLAFVLRGQSTARETTPGTFDYNDLTPMRPAVEAPWNTWLTNCATTPDGTPVTLTPGIMPATTPQKSPAVTPATKPASDPFLMILAFLAATAGLVYMSDRDQKNKKEKTR